jgi:phosphate-induced protein 1
MLGTTHIYYIWYGNWARNSAKDILETFADSIGGTPWYNINTSYYQGLTQTADNSINNAAAFKASAYDDYSRGTAISDNDVGSIVQDQVDSGKLPNDPKHGVYFVLTSADVTETSGFCTSYCAWHGYQPQSNGTSLKLAFIGNAEQQCPFNCIYNFQTPMSGNLGADGMANAIAHELAESVTDPVGTGWINLPAGIEIGDLCAFIFGDAYHSGYANDPYPPNMYFEGIPYLIQELWVNRHGGYCSLRYPGGQ